MAEQGGANTPKAAFFILVIVGCGFISAVGQIIILRDLLVLFYGNELSLGLILTSWLLWTALGSILGGRIGAGITKAVTVLPLVLVVLALLLPGSVLWLRASRILWAIPTGEMIGPVAMLLISFAGTGCFCLTSGALFGLTWAMLAARSESGSGRPLLIYLGEALGAAAGGLFCYWVLLPRTSILTAVLFLGLIVLALAAVLLAWQRCLSLRRPAHPAFLLVALALLAGALVGSRDLDQASRRWQWGPTLLTVRDTPFQNLAMLAEANQFSLFANGLLFFSYPDPQAAEYAVHLAMLQHQAPEAVLVIGGGVGGLLPEILKHPGVRRVDYVEPDPEVIELAEEFLPRSATDALLDRRLGLFHADAGRFMRAAERRYDVVIMQLGDPVTAEINRFYTTEGYARVARLLRPDGIFTFAISSSPEMVGPTEAQLLQSVYHTLHGVFPEVLVVPGANARFFASAQTGRLTAEPAELLRRLTARALELHFVREYYLLDYLHPTRLTYLQAILAQSQARTVNRDFEPTCYYHGLVVAAGQLHPRLGEAFQALSRVGHQPFWVMIGVLSAGLVLIFGGRRGSLRRAICLNVLLVGAIEMVLEMILLLGFQILEGLLYRQLAMIIASFMVGMSLGTGLLTMLATRIARPRRWFALVQFALTLYLLGILGLFSWLHHPLEGSPQTILAASPVFALLALGAGILGGCHFTLGVQAASILPGYSETTGPGLYGMDLLGAMGGSLVASLFLLPVYGLPTAMLALALVSLAGVVTLLGK